MSANFSKTLHDIKNVLSVIVAILTILLVGTKYLNGDFSSKQGATQVFTGDSLIHSSPIGTLLQTVKYPTIKDTLDAINKTTAAFVETINTLANSTEEHKEGWINSLINLFEFDSSIVEVSNLIGNEVFTKSYRADVYIREIVANYKQKYPNLKFNVQINSFGNLRHDEINAIYEQIFKTSDISDQSKEFPNLNSNDNESYSDITDKVMTIVIKNKKETTGPKIVGRIRKITVLTTRKIKDAQ